MSEYLKLPEVAQRLGVSEKTARRYIKQGTLPSVFIGGAYRVVPEDVAAFLEKARVSPKAEEQREELDKLRALLVSAGAKTSHLALPEAEFQALWQGKTPTQRARINRELLAERNLVKPLLAQWTSMPASKERSQLHRLWLQVFARSLTIAVERNQEAAQAEAEAARQAGDEARAEEVLTEAEEFAKTA